jgi:hypothetical protein
MEKVSEAAMTHPMARRLRITGMHRRVAQTSPIYQVTQCLRIRRRAEVSGKLIATTVSAWLAELGVDSPLVEDLAQAVRVCDWASAHAIGEYLSVDVTLAA